MRFLFPDLKGEQVAELVSRAFLPAWQCGANHYSNVISNLEASQIGSIQAQQERPAAALSIQK